jgi:hypothetical protein
MNELNSEELDSRFAWEKLLKAYLELFSNA